MSAAEPVPFWPFWHAYDRTGWSAFPLPERSKKCRATGVHGRNGKPPSAIECEQWATEFSNVAVLMPRNVPAAVPYSVIGIDVDQYEEKHGAETITSLIPELGGWPRTWRSTSRGIENPSGIRFFRVKAGIELEERRLPDCEIVEWWHRYAVAWPSVHDKNGRRYEWITPENKLANLVLPTAENPKFELPDHQKFPWLPQKWLNFLIKKPGSTNGVRVSDAAALAWIAEHDDGGEPCTWMQKVLDAAEDDLHSPGARHVSMRDGMLPILRAGERRHRGLGAAMDEFYTSFLSLTVVDATSQRERVSAFDRARTGAVSLIEGKSSEYRRDEWCSCDLYEDLDDEEIEDLREIVEKLGWQNHG